ncbi:MAG: hypothetical protein QM723_17650 [Myxococcaceae bacterium]
MRLRLAFAALASLVFHGCSCGDDCRTSVQPPPPMFFKPPGRVSEPYNLLIADGVKSTTCASGKTSNTFSTHLNASLVGPDNHPVPLISPVEPFDPMMLLRFQFTPPTPGVYHFTVRFEPDFGTLQTDVMVASDAADAGFGSFDVPRECTRFDHLGDVALCIEPKPDAGELFTVFNGQVVSTTPALDFAVAPELSGVWSVAPNDESSDLLRFHQLSDAGVLSLVSEQVVQNLALGQSCNSVCAPNYAITDARLLARGDTALLLQPPSWSFARLDGGALQLTTSSLDKAEMWPHLFAQWSDGEQLETVGGSPNFGVRVCNLPLDGGQHCTEPLGIPIGATAGGVWVFDNLLTRTVLGFAWGPRNQPVTTTLPLLDPAEMPDPPKADSAPRWNLDMGVAVLGVRDGDHVLEFYPFDHSDTDHWDVDSRHLWKWNVQTQKLTFMER